MSNQKTSRQQILQHVMVIVGFILLAVIYCWPVTEGKVLEQHDIVQGMGMSKEIKDFREATGEEALWTNSMFGGMPSFAISTKYKTNVFTWIQSAIDGILPNAVAKILMLCIGMFVLLRALGVNLWLSAAGALVFAFSSNYLVSLEAGHNTKVLTMAYTTGALGGIIAAYRGRVFIGALVTAFFMGMMFVPDHLQIIYYFIIVTGVVFIAYLIEAIREGKLAQFAKVSLVLLAAGIIGLIPNTARLWSTYSYGQETMRGGASELSSKENTEGLEIDYAMRWSTRPDETATVLVPYYMGGSSNESLGDGSDLGKTLTQIGVQQSSKQQVLKNVPLYFGEMPFTSGPVYFGATILLLFLLGMLTLKQTIRWWVLVAIILSCFMAWGRHFLGFNEFLFNHLPLYNKFRTPSMALHIAGFLIPMLGMVGLASFMKNKESNSDKIKWLIRAGAGIAGVLVLLAIFGVMRDYSLDSDVSRFTQMFGLNTNDQQQFGILNQLVEAVQADRERLYFLDILRSFIFAGAIFGVLWFWLKGRIKNLKLVYGALALIMLVDVWMVSKRYLNNDDFKRQTNIVSQYYQPSQADRQILQDPDPYYRVFNVTNNPFNDAITSYYHKSVGGYHAAKLQRYQDMIDYHIGLQHQGVLNMLNTKYYIVPGQNKQPTAVPNQQAIGNAWFVPDYKLVPTADREIMYLDAVYEIKDVQGKQSIFVRGEGASIDTVGSYSTITIAPGGSVDDGFMLDLNRKQLQPGRTYLIGSGDTCDFKADKGNLAPIQAELKLIYRFDPAQTAIVHKQFADYVQPLGDIAPQPSDNIDLTEYAPNHLVFKSNTSGERLAVFSDIYYTNGWNAYIDNQKADYIRVNYILRGLKIPAGEHTVEWRFEPRSYITGSKISLAGSAIFILLFGAFFYNGIRNRKKKVAAQKA